MHLERIRLSNFRAFRTAELSLPASGVVLIAGANNVGKSALLSALDVVAGHALASPLRFHGSTESAAIQAIFRLSEPDRYRIGGDGPTVQDWLTNTPIFSSITLEFSEAQEGRLYLAELKTQDIDGQEFVFARVDPFGNPSANWIDLEQQVRNPLTGSLPTLRAPGLQRNVQPADAEYLRNNTPGAPQLALMLREWSQGLYHFSAIRTGTARYSPIGDIVPALNPSGDNLAQCLLYHFSQKTEIWTRVVALVAEVLPDAGDLVVPASGNQLEIAFVDPISGDRRNLKDLGSGVEQLLMTAYVGETQAAGSVTLIEEPETSLHPTAQRELLRHVERLAEDRLVVATTHSSVVLDSRTGGYPGSTWLVSRLAGASEVVEVTNDLGPTLAEIGVRLSDVLSAERIVLVEGETDAEIVRTWFAARLAETRSAVVAMGGGDRAYHLETIELVLSSADRLPRQILFIRDRDELPAHSQSELEARGVAVLARRELENYFLDQPMAVFEALTERTIDGTLDIDETSIRDVIRAAAEELRDLVVFKRVVQDLPARVLSRRDIKALLQKDGPSRAALQRSLEDADARVRAASKGLEDQWRHEEAAVDEVWEARWLELAPGADVLSSVWKRAGVSYDKARDGGRIARAMPGAPEEIANLLDAFLDAAGTAV